MQQFHNVANFPLVHKYVAGSEVAQGRASAPTATG
jgi:hypothetical protein